MEHFIILPVLIPLVTAVAILLLRRRMRAIRAVALLGVGAELTLAITLLASTANGRILVTQMGGWPAPYGITFAVDLLGAMLLVMSTLMGAVVLVYSVGSLDAAREQMGFYALYHFMLMGVCGSFIVGDLFTLYVFFEVMLISSFGLMTLGGERGQLEGGLKYVVINMISSTLFVSALGVLYGITGTLNMADLAQRVMAMPPGLAVVMGSMFVVAFGIKAGLFPLFFWLPASYHTPPPAVTALFGGLLTKVGVYALIRTFTLIFRADPAYNQVLFLWVAGLTMLAGILGAVVQRGFRRALSFNLISHIGYIIMGLGLGSTLALAGAIFYTVHHIVVMTALLLLAGLAEQLTGAKDIHSMGGLWKQQPLIGAPFLVSALSLAGLPPFSGFFAKFMLISAGLESKQYLIVGISLVVSLLTLLSMTIVWNEAFWKPGQQNSKSQAPTWLMVAPALLLTLVTIVMGLGAERVATLALQAANQLGDPSLYLTAVLGAGQ